MPTMLSRKCRRNLALLLVAACAVAGGAVLHAAPAVAKVAEAGEAPAVLTCDRDGLRYEYHVPTGGECLHDLARDPQGLVNLLHDHEDVAAACRVDLAGRLGVADLSDLRAGYAEQIRRLHAVGYF
jgi:hypothetical protein